MLFLPRIFLYGVNALKIEKKSLFTTTDHRGHFLGSFLPSQYLGSSRKCPMQYLRSDQEISNALPRQYPGSGPEVQQYEITRKYIGSDYALPRQYPSSGPDVKSRTFPTYCLASTQEVTRNVPAHCLGSNQAVAQKYNSMKFPMQCLVDQMCYSIKIHMHCLCSNQKVTRKFPTYQSHSNILLGELLHL